MLVDDIIDYLVKKSNLKVTAQRRGILRIFVDNKDKHLTVDEVYDLIRKRGMSIGLVTIYRTIDLLEEEGIVAKRDLGGDSAKYELVFNESQHHHLVCKDCGRVIEIDELLPDNLEEIILKKEGFKVTNYSLKIYGYCKDCR